MSENMHTNNQSDTLKICELLCERKLNSSGLTLEDSKLLGMSFLPPSETRKLHPSFKAHHALKIPYFCPRGFPLPDRPSSPPFYRLRYLYENPNTSPLPGKQKPIRYIQEPLTCPVAYFPRSFDWSKVSEDVSTPLIITEGELKAAKACKEGFPTIGLGGVFSFKSYTFGHILIPSLKDLIKWNTRHVYICFDSDYKNNAMICKAINDLYVELHHLGALCHLTQLPHIQGMDKVGIDDFLTLNKVDGRQLFLTVLSKSEPIGVVKGLFDLNTRYVYVRDPGLIMDQQSKSKISPSSFKEHLEVVLRHQERQVNKDGSISTKLVALPAYWLKWGLRNEVSKLTYKPGAPKYVEDSNYSHPLFNVWSGWGVPPIKGDVSLFLKLVDHLFEGAEPQAKCWFLNWCAFPLQNPGVKMFSSAVLHGVKHGTGKSLIGYTLGRIYGSNFTEISQMDLHNSFNEWAEGKQFVMGDDVTGSNKRQDADFLKKLITQKQLRVNGKYVPSYVVPDCINYFFTANHPDSFFLEDDDRRYFIHEITVAPLSEQFYKEYDSWVNGEGASYIFDYLLGLDLKSFNPSAPAFRTLAKERMIDNVRSDLASWVRSLLATPDHYLMVGGEPILKDLFTSKGLLALYDPSTRTGTTGGGLGRELARAGVRQVNDGKPIRLKDGSLSRYWIIRNASKWLQASLPAVIEHIEGSVPAPTPKSKF